MHRKLLTLLVSACALAAVLAGPATASASTLSLQGAVYPDTNEVYFEADSTTVTFGSFSAQCGEFSFRAEITQNAADPVTLNLLTAPTYWSNRLPRLDGCPSGISYSSIQATGPMKFNADGTGTLPLRVTETWSGSSCVREGTLNLTYTPDPDGQWDGNGDPVKFDGYLNRVSGSIVCPPKARLQGSFGGLGSSDAPTDETGSQVDFVVTP